MLWIDCNWIRRTRDTNTFWSCNSLWWFNRWIKISQFGLVREVVILNKLKCLCEIQVSIWKEFGICWVIKFLIKCLYFFIWKICNACWITSTVMVVCWFLEGVFSRQFRENIIWRLVYSFHFIEHNSLINELSWFLINIIAPSFLKKIILAEKRLKSISHIYFN